MEANLIGSVLDPPTYEQPKSGSGLGCLDGLVSMPVLIRPGTRLLFDRERLEYRVRCMDRYYTSSENKFYRALSALRDATACAE